jgi:hypothetical protein
MALMLAYNGSLSPFLVFIVRALSAVRVTVGAGSGQVNGAGCSQLEPRMACANSFIYFINSIYAIYAIAYLLTCSYLTCPPIIKIFL